MLQVNGTPKPIRVLIVDDVRSIRLMIRAMLRADPLVEVVGEAEDPYAARAMIRDLNPDVITLDVVMPRMDGLSFLERLMDLRPMPVVMVSTQTTERSQEAVRALSLGAVDCVDLAQLRKTGDAGALARIVRMAATSNLGDMARRRRVKAPRVLSRLPFRWNGKVVLVGSSTGGVDALLQLLSELPPDGPPILIAQHMPPSFLESFAARLERTSRISVALSHGGARLDQGRVYLAAGGAMHAVLSATDPCRVTHVPHDGRHVHVPSVDLLFKSAVSHATRTIGVMLTGMGSDGAEQLLEMRRAGAHTIVQDSASAVIDGMPRAAREIGAAAEVASLSRIAERILASTAEGGWPQ